MGVTHIVSSFRRSETASIADVDAAKEGGGCIPLRTYGPYRSDYGRLAEFPDLPPLLVRCFCMTLVDIIDAVGAARMFRNNGTGQIKGYELWYY